MHHSKFFYLLAFIIETTRTQDCPSGTHIQPEDIPDWLVLASKHDSRANTTKYYCQGLQQVPDSIPTYVRKISILGNPLTSLQDYEFVEFPLCLSLNLAWNEIKTLEARSLWGLFALEELYLQFNVISVLPPAIFIQVIITCHL